MSNVLEREYRARTITLNWQPSYADMDTAIKYEAVYTGSDAPSVENAPSSTQDHINLRLRSTAEKIAAVKSSFSLRTKELADVLHVERQTIYAWIRGENEPIKQTMNRLDLFVKLADHWNTLSLTPLSHQLLVDQSQEEKSLLAVFCEAVDVDSVKNYLISYVNSQNATNKPQRKFINTKSHDSVINFMIPTVSLRED